MALIISSFGKMLLILMVIWDYKQLEYSWLVSIIVLASNTEALSGIFFLKKMVINKGNITDFFLYQVYMNIPYFKTLLIISLGNLGRIFAQFIFLYLTYFNDKSEGVSSYLTKSRWISI
jgi:hypothetical protein